MILIFPNDNNGNLYGSYGAEVTNDITITISKQITMLFGDWNIVVLQIILNQESIQSEENSESKEHKQLYIKLFDKLFLISN